MEKFFQILKNKLSVKVDENFDATFWAKFENEFGQTARAVEKTTFSWPWTWNWQNSLGLVAVCLLVIVTGVTVYDRVQVPLDSDMELAVLAVEMGPALEHMDVFSEWEEIDLSEEEWNALLADV